MEAEMTTPVPAENHLLTWWATAQFDGKEYCDLKEDGSLCLVANPFFPERLIAHLTADNAAAITKALSDKFPEVAGRIIELSGEWDSTDDKFKLSGKVSRLKDYLQQTAAIGNFEPLGKHLVDWQNTLDNLTEEHYKAKRVLLDKAMALAEQDTWKETTQAFRDLTEEWKKSGFIDKQRSDELWLQLDAARNKFYERKRVHHEGVEHEMMQNLDLKMELVEKAEQYAASEKWKEVTEIFKNLMDEWKGIGRTVADKNEALWQRFIMAKNVFFDRKKAHFETIQHEQETNYARKVAIVEQAEAISESKEWNATSTAFAGLMDEWKAIGRVPAEKADELWDRFSKAKDIFFNNKRHYFEANRVTQDDNLAQKRALVNRAQQLKNSTDWRGATEEFGELMEEWKKIGPVSRDQSEKVWEEFITARRTFFDNKDADRERRKSQIEKQHSSRLEQTRQFLQTLQDELKEDALNLEDFKESLSKITPGPKEKELRAHLEKLIAQASPNMVRKQEKIAVVEQQLKELEEGGRKPRKEDSKKEDTPVAE